MEKTNYLNETVWCKLSPSPLHGVGVFAIRDIPKGTRLTDYYGGKIGFLEVPEDEFNLIDEDVRTLILDRTLFQKHKPLIFMSPNQNQILQAFMNNSKDANSDGHKALRDIKRGEEVTENYEEIASNSLHPISQPMNNKSTNEIT